MAVGQTYSLISMVMLTLKKIMPQKLEENDVSFETYATLIRKKAIFVRHFDINFCKKLRYKNATIKQKNMLAIL